jgi:hypothetical protein
MMRPFGAEVVEGRLAAGDEKPRGRPVGLHRDLGWRLIAAPGPLWSTRTGFDLEAIPERRPAGQPCRVVA